MTYRLAELHVTILKGYFTGDLVKRFIAQECFRTRIESGFPLFTKLLRYICFTALSRFRGALWLDFTKCKGGANAKMSFWNLASGERSLRLLLTLSPSLPLLARVEPSFL